MKRGSVRVGMRRCPQSMQGVMRTPRVCGHGGWFQCHSPGMHAMQAFQRGWTPPPLRSAWDVCSLSRSLRGAQHHLRRWHPNSCVGCVCVHDPFDTPEGVASMHRCFQNNVLASTTTSFVCSGSTVGPRSPPPASGKPQRQALRPHLPERAAESAMHDLPCSCGFSPRTTVCHSACRTFFI